MKRLEGISRNKNKSELDRFIPGNLKITSLNCRSLKKHIEDITSDLKVISSACKKLGLRLKKTLRISRYQIMISILTAMEREKES